MSVSCNQWHACFTILLLYYCYGFSFFRYYFVKQAEWRKARHECIIYQQWLFSFPLHNALSSFYCSWSFFFVVGSLYIWILLLQLSYLCLDYLSYFEAMCSVLVW